MAAVRLVQKGLFIRRQIGTAESLNAGLIQLDAMGVSMVAIPGDPGRADVLLRDGRAVSIYPALEVSHG